MLSDQRCQVLTFPLPSLPPPPSLLCPQRFHFTVEFRKSRKKWREESGRSGLSETVKTGC